MYVIAFLVKNGGGGGGGSTGLDDFCAGRPKKQRINVTIIIV